MACEAEAMGYDSVWVGDRVLFPVALDVLSRGRLRLAQAAGRDPARLELVGRANRAAEAGYSGPRGTWRP